MATNTYPRPSFWRRWMDSVIDGRQRDAERVWSELVSKGGDRLTDEMERRIGLFL